MARQKLTVNLTSGVQVRMGMKRHKKHAYQRSLVKPLRHDESTTCWHVGSTNKEKRQELFYYAITYSNVSNHGPLTGNKGSEIADVSQLHQISITPSLVSHLQQRQSLGLIIHVCHLNQLRIEWWDWYNVAQLINDFQIKVSFQQGWTSSYLILS